MLIYHIVLPEKWEQIKGQSNYSADSLDTEGFIHCSYDHQLSGVLRRYYSEIDKIVVLKIDIAKLTSKLVSEPSTGGEIYPHIYGPINMDAVAGVEELSVRQQTSTE